MVKLVVRHERSLLLQAELHLFISPVLKFKVSLQRTKFTQLHRVRGLFGKNQIQTNHMGLIPTKGDGEGVMLVAVTSAFLALALVAVALRVWSRRLKRTALVTNDYLVLLALVCLSKDLPFICL